MIKNKRFSSTARICEAARANDGQSAFDTGGAAKVQDKATSHYGKAPVQPFRCVDDATDTDASLHDDVLCVAADG